MSFLKIDIQTKQCLWITACSLLLWRIGIFLRTTSLINIYLVKRMLDIFPNFILSIAVPFALLALIHPFRFINETRIFYYMLYLFLFFMLTGGYILKKNYNIPFDVYMIIASFTAVFIDMVIQNIFEKNLRMRDDINGRE